MKNLKISKAFLSPTATARMLAACIPLLAAPSLFANPSYADCEIVGAKQDSALEDFKGGSLRVDLSTGNTELRHGRENNLTVKNLITNETVSTFLTSRSACNIARETILRRDGSLRALKFSFSNCLNREPLGYVRAEVEFDLTGNFGTYREILLTPRGASPSDFIKIANCTVGP